QPASSKQKIQSAKWATERCYERKHVENSGDDDPNPRQLAVLPGVLHPPRSQSPGWEQQRETGDRSHRIESRDGIQDRCNDEDSNANQDVIPELRTSDAPREVHVMVLDRIHEIQPKLVEVHRSFLPCRAERFGLPILRAKNGQWHVSM